MSNKIELDGLVFEKANSEGTTHDMMMANRIRNRNRKQVMVERDCFCCEGTGEWESEDCEGCAGSGRVVARRTVKAYVRKGLLQQWPKENSDYLTT